MLGQQATMKTSLEKVTGYFTQNVELQSLMGWAFNPEEPSTSQAVDIFVDGDCVGSILASLPRPDLNYLGTGFNNYGFEFNFPNWKKNSSEEVKIEVRHNTSGTSIRCKSRAMQTAQVTEYAAPIVGIDSLSQYLLSSEVYTVELASNGWMGERSLQDKLLGIELKHAKDLGRMSKKTNGLWQYQARVDDFCIPDAVVIMPWGVVIADGKVVRGRTGLPSPGLITAILQAVGTPPDQQQYTGGRLGENNFRTVFRTDIRLVEKHIIEINQPTLLMSAPNYNGYYHWHIDVLPVLSRLNKFGDRSISDILCCEGSHAWQHESMLNVQSSFESMNFRPISQLRVFRVKELFYSSGLSGNGAYLCPDITDFYAQLSSSCPNFGPPPNVGKYIYLTRRSNPRRKLSNELEIEDMVRSLGFSVIDPASFSYAQQRAIFRSAELVVSPHGAALSNLVYCSDGTGVIELFADSYLNLSLQRLANLKNAKYGYVVGRSTPSQNPASVHDLNYHIPVEELRELIAMF